jgi:hypothetical protein
LARRTAFSSRQIWQEQLFRLQVNPGENGNSPDGGDWDVVGYISKTGDSGDIGAASWSEYKVRLSSLICNQQAKGDRKSASNEPFVIGALSAHPGPVDSMLSPVFGGVKGRDKTSNPTKDSQRALNHEFQTIRVLKEVGMVSVAISVWEHDDESEKKRKELRDKFVERWVDAKAQERNWLDTMGAAIAEDWQLGEVEVTAWTRNGQVKVGVIHKPPVNEWINCGKSLPITFNNPGCLLCYPITTDELMPNINPGDAPASETPPTTPTEPAFPPTPTEPSVPTTPTILSGPSPEQIALLDKFVGKWQTPFGVLTLARDGDRLRGDYRRVDLMTRIENNAGTIELSASADATRIEGPVTFGQTRLGPMSWTLGSDGDTFSGTYNYGGVNPHNGRRIKDAPPASPTTPTVPSNPNLPPSVPTIPKLPTTVPSVPPSPDTGGLDGFRALRDWNVKIDNVRVAPGNQIEVLATYKNMRQREMKLSPGDVEMVITDGDGAGFKEIGNLYRAPAQPDLALVHMARYPELGAGGAFQTLVLFDLPKGTTSLKTFTVFGSQTDPISFDVSNLTLPTPVSAVTRPIPNSVGQSNFAEMGDYDVRVDGVKRGRGDTIHVFLTLKNVGEKLLRAPGGDLNVAILDADSVSNKDDGNTYRASGKDAAPTRLEFSASIAPEGEFAVRYIVNMPKGAVAKQLLLSTYGDKKHMVELPALP